MGGGGIPTPRTMQVQTTSVSRIRAVRNPERFRIPVEPAPCTKCEGRGTRTRTRGVHKVGCGCVACRPCPRCNGTGLDPELTRAGATSHFR